MNLKELKYRIITSVILLPIIIYIILINNIFFPILLLTVLLISTYEWFEINKKKISIIFILGFLFLLLSIYQAYYLRGDGNENLLNFLWIVFACVFSDVGGFVFGNIFGRKKITKISPNKTYAGMYGSFLFSIFPIIILYFLSYKLFGINLDLNLKYILLSFLFSFTCQVGDIIVSYFKRKNKLKNTGKILPGHGGILDRVDGLIFVFILAGFLQFLKFI
jgi:phosphatidate cytidylyltransferase